MAQLIFPSVSGGTVTLNGPNTAGTYNLAVPAANGTLLYQDLTGLVTFTNVNVTGTLSITGTSAFKIPSGNTTQRPAGPVAGQIRYNTDGGGLYEAYVPSVSAWQKFVLAPEGQYNINYVVVGGGAGGSGQYPGGGGGGGQFVSSVATAIPGTVFTIYIGGGGAPDSDGTTTTISGFAQAIGGGRSLTAGYGGVSGNGYAGGSRYDGDGITSYTAAGAGGGAAANGGSGNGGGSPGGTGGTGGAGAQTLITGSSTYFGGGGGGGSQIIGQGGAGGTGGGGAGHGSSGNGGNGSVNTGGGGGGTGANNGSIYFGGSGGSGVVILSMAAASYTGTITGSPTVVNTGTTVILTYTSSGTYTA